MSIKILFRFQWLSRNELHLSLVSLDSLHLDFSRAAFALDKICALATATILLVYVCRACATFLQKVDRQLGNFATVYVRCNCGTFCWKRPPMQNNGFVTSASTIVRDAKVYCIYFSDETMKADRNTVMRIAWLYLHEGILH